jgi:hypothetical protein
VEAWIHQLVPGDFMALFYSSRAEQLSFAIPYLKAGLAQRQRCLYVADDTPVALIIRRLEEAGVDVTSAQKRGALEVLTKHETYLKGGQFDPDRMISYLRAAVESALASGFTALRGSGDMCWALQNPVLLKQMIEYQRKLYRQFPENFLALCQYDRARFPADILAEMERLHNVIIRDGVMSRIPGKHPTASLRNSLTEETSG